MKFQTKDLIARIDETIKAITAATHLANAQRQTERGNARTEWITTLLPAFEQFAATIKTKSRKGSPITEDDCPKEIIGRYGDGLKFWDAPELTPLVPRVEGLKALRATLTACTDETITTTGLRELGFRDINSLFVGA